MEETIIHDAENKSQTLVLHTDEVEYSDPVQYYRNNIIQSKKALLKVSFQLKKPPFPIELLDDFIYNEAVKTWREHFSRVIRVKVPENFILLLNASTKKEQERLLKGQSITPDQLYSFIFRAWLEHGFSLSEYFAEHLHKGADVSTLPQLISIENGKVYKVGETPLSDGQLKQVIEHRRVVASKFLDNGEAWHCFFITYESIGGKESWENGQPHFHYISNKYGIPRHIVVEQLKSKNYKLPSMPHIAYNDHRSQKAANNTP